MIAKVGWHPDTVWHLTLRNLVIAYDSLIFDQWNHTAVVACQVYNLSVLVVNMMGKSKIQPRTPEHFHPFMEVKKRGLKITKDNFSILKVAANAMARS